MTKSWRQEKLRDQFRSLTYTIFFPIADPEKLVGHSRTYRQAEGFFICEAEEIKELNEISARIKESGGSVEKIESRYPSLEEMLVKTGK